MEIKVQTLHCAATRHKP